MDYKRMWNELREKIYNLESFYQKSFSNDDFKKDRLEVVEYMKQFMWDCEIKENSDT